MSLKKVSRCCHECKKNHLKPNRPRKTLLQLPRRLQQVPRLRRPRPQRAVIVHRLARAGPALRPEPTPPVGGGLGLMQKRLRAEWLRVLV